MFTSIYPAVTSLRPNELHFADGIKIIDRYPSSGVIADTTIIDTTDFKSIELSSQGTIDIGNYKSWLKSNNVNEEGSLFWDKNLGFIEITSPGDKNLEVYIDDWMSSSNDDPEIAVGTAKHSNEMVRILRDPGKSGGFKPHGPQTTPANATATASVTGQLFSPFNNLNLAKEGISGPLDTDLKTFSKWEKQFSTTFSIKTKKMFGGGLFFDLTEDKKAAVIGAYATTDAAGIPQQGIPLFMQLDDTHHDREGNTDLGTGVHRYRTSLDGINHDPRTAQAPNTVHFLTFVGIGAETSLNNLPPDLGYNKTAAEGIAGTALILPQITSEFHGYTANISETAQLTIIKANYPPGGTPAACVMISSARAANEYIENAGSDNGEIKYTHFDTSSPSNPLATYGSKYDTSMCTRDQPSLLLNSVEVVGAGGGKILGKMADSWSGVSGSGKLKEQGDCRLGLKAAQVQKPDNTTQPMVSAPIVHPSHCVTGPSGKCSGDSKNKGLASQSDDNSIANCVRNTGANLAVNHVNSNWHQSDQFDDRKAMGASPAVYNNGYSIDPVDSHWRLLGIYDLTRPADDPTATPTNIFTKLGGKKMFIQINVNMYHHNRYARGWVYLVGVFRCWDSHDTSGEAHNQFLTTNYAGFDVEGNSSYSPYGYLPLFLAHTFEESDGTNFTHKCQSTAFPPRLEIYANFMSQRKPGSGIQNNIMFSYDMSVQLFP